MATIAARMKAKLSKRLSCVASMVDQGVYLADIGSDHALLPIFLLEKGTISYAQAIDNKTGPYLRMKANVEEAGLSDRIQCLLSDGLQQIGEEVDAVSICGIGGLLMCDILEKGKDNLLGVKYLYLDPHRDLAKVRAKINELGYQIMDENVVYEDKTFYHLIKAKKESKVSTLSEADLLFGPINRKKRSQEFLSFLSEQKKKISSLLDEKLSPAARESYLHLYRLIKAEEERKS